jgi:hypothetical protein
LLHCPCCLDLDPPICASLCSWIDRHASPCPATGWDGVSWIFFCLGWSWTIILLISTSQGAKIIGLSHHTWPIWILIIS